MKEKEWQKLTWQTYPDHLKEIMHNLLTTDDCKDVTLVSDDMKSIKAHRNILSACSPLFKNIFQIERTIITMLYSFKDCHIQNLNP